MSLSVFDFVLVLASLLALLGSLSSQAEFSFSPAKSIAVGEKGGPLTRRPRPLLLAFQGECDKPNPVLAVDFPSVSVPLFCPVLLSVTGSSPPSLEFHSAPQRLEGPLVLRRSIDLGSGGVIRKGRDIVGLSSGMISPSLRVVVAISSGFEVFCLDGSLALLWRRQMEIENPGDLIQEISILIEPRAMRLNDTGAIIVGVRMAGLAEAERRRKAASAAVVAADAAASGIAEDSNGSSESLLKDSEKPLEPSHLSYYAFEGLTGADRWQHASGDFLPVSAANELLHPQHSVHSGEVDWRNFRESLTNSLPHYWSSEVDSSLKSAHFERTRAKGGKEKKTNKNRPSPLGGTSAPVETPRPQKQNLNALVFHQHRGLEVLHYYSGRPLCQLPLTAGHLHADLNGDGSIDHLTSVAPLQDFEDLINSPFQPLDKARPLSHASHNEPRACLAIATTGVPANSQLFNASLCRAGWQTLFSMQSQRFGSASELAAASSREAELSLFSAPLIIKNAGKFSYRTFFLASSGIVTALASDGSQLFKTNTDAFWSSPESDKQRVEDQKATVKKGGEAGQREALRRLKIARSKLRPSIEAFSPYAQAEPLNAESAHLIAIGENRAVLLDSHGAAISSAALVDSPVDRPLIGDFNGDGLNDLIVPAAHEITVFLSKQKMGNKLATVGTAVLLALTAAALAVKLANERKKNQSKPRRNNKTMKAG